MKSRDEIFAHLVEVMVDTFELDPSELTLEADLREGLGLDSIDAVDMAVKIQEFTGKKPGFLELAGLSTLGDVVDLIEKQLQAGAGSTANENEQASTGS